MSNVVFVLGAGASRQGGAPIMSDFLDIASDLLFANRIKNKDSFQRVFKTRGNFQAAHSKAQLDIDNIEALFTALELSKIIRAVPGGSADDIPMLIQDLKTLIVETLESTLLFPGGREGLRAPQPYPLFAQLIDHIIHNDKFPRSASIITFNYDIAIDHALEREEITFNYAVDDPAFGEVDLLKLHGSVNWAVEKESRRIHPMLVRNYLQWVSTQRLMGAGGLHLKCSTALRRFFHGRNVKVEDTPLIVPPSWNKSDYHVALSDVWAKAATNLSEAEYVFIIGYSLPETDAFFRHLYALGSIGERGFRRIEVFNPDAGVEQRFRDLLGPGALSRFKFHSKTFDQAIPVIQSYFPSKK